MFGFQNPTSTKLTNVSELVSDPIQVQIFVGGEAYLVTQQDVRTITDNRYVSIVQISTGQQMHLNQLQVDENAIFNALNNAGNFGQNQSTRCLPSPPTVKYTAPIKTQLDWNMNCEQKNPLKKYPQPMEISSNDSSKKSFIITQPKCCACKRLICRGINTDDFIESINHDENAEPSAKEQLKHKKIHGCFV